MDLTQSDLIEEWKQYQEPVNRVKWDQYFILQAYLVSTRSLDAQTQCGCVVVDNHHRIIATGYNGFIGNINDEVLPNLRPAKYPFMIHAEANAIATCARNGVSCKNNAIYVTGKPCISCLQLIHQAGICRIYYYTKHHIHMVADEKENVTFDILKSLLPIYIKPLEFNEKFSDKIDKIKSCREP